MSFFVESNYICGFVDDNAHLKSDSIFDTLLTSILFPP